MSYRIGEMIHIWWEDEPEVEYVRGHVAPHDAIARVARNDGLDECDFESHAPHVYIRFRPDPEFGQRLMGECPLGRGAIPVTKVIYK